jgi:hypothetical protein
MTLIFLYLLIAVVCYGIQREYEERTTATKSTKSRIFMALLFPLWLPFVLMMILVAIFQIKE